MSDVHNEIGRKKWNYLFFFSIFFCPNQMVFWHIFEQKSLEIYIFIYFFLFYKLSNYNKLLFFCAKSWKLPVFLYISLLYLNFFGLKFFFTCFFFRKKKLKNQVFELRTFFQLRCKLYSYLFIFFLLRYSILDVIWNENNNIINNKKKIFVLQ